MGAYSHQQDPDNEYLLITSKSGQGSTLLENLTEEAIA